MTQELESNEICATEIYAAAFEKWGYQSQVNMTLEELAEASLAVNKLFNRDWSMNRLIDLASEFADVTIMMDQIKYLLEIHPLPTGCEGMNFCEMVDNQINYKLDRLAGRVGLIETTKE